MTLCRVAHFVVSVGAVLFVATACKEDAAPPSSSAPGQAAEPAKSTALPALELRPGTDKKLYLTYLEAGGDFLIVERIDDVPVAARAAVRVVVAGEEAGTGQEVYVADLRAPGSNGAYSVRVMSRAEWDQLGADKRATKLEDLAPKVQPDTKAAGTAPLRAVIYGADWCKPCHDAEAFLKSLGVQVTKKDVDQSKAASAEMQQKLLQINRPGGGIPVIDLDGQIMQGFNRSAVERAVQVARNKQAL